MPQLAREYFVSGGTLPLDSESYIERSADSALVKLLAAGRYCYVLNSRQMGKSSLSVRTIARLNERGIQTIFIDLTQIGQNVQAEQWYAGLTVEVGRALGLASQVLKYFKSRTELNPMQRFFGAIREVVLEEISESIVIIIDEIDGTRNLPFDTDEFYAGIRECFNRRVHDQACERLTFCLIGVAVPNDLIRNPSMTPFNIGERIRLQDFELDEVRRFGAFLGPSGDRLARRVHYWTSGQPFLTQNLCREIASDTRIQEERDVDALVQRLYFGPKALETNLNLADVANRVLWDSEQSGDPDTLDLPTLVETADHDDGPFGDHLKRLLISVSQFPNVLQAMKSSLGLEEHADPESIARLVAAGVLRVDSKGQAVPACDLYSRYLKLHIALS